MKNDVFLITFSTNKTSYLRMTYDMLFQIYLLGILMVAARHSANIRFLVGMSP